MDYQQSRAQATPAIDVGLREYMLKVYNYMASGLALTGLVAYILFQATAVTGPTGDIVGLTNLGVSLYTGPMMWVVALAPLGVVMYMSFGIRNMSASRAQTMFWVFAFLMGLSLSTIFLTPLGANQDCKDTINPRIINANEIDCKFAPNEVPSKYGSEVPIDNHGIRLLKSPIVATIWYSILVSPSVAGSDTSHSCSETISTVAW